MLADIVESLIGAAYEHGGFDLAIDCAKRFGLGLSWKKLPERIVEMHKVEDSDDLPERPCSPFSLMRCFGFHSLAQQSPSPQKAYDASNLMFSDHSVL